MTLSLRCTPHDPAITLLQFRPTMSQLETSADPILCRCFQVRQSTIQDCVTLLGAKNFTDVRTTCGAGQGCMACRRRIQAILDQRNAPQPRLPQE